MDWSSWAYWLKGNDGNLTTAKRLQLSEGAFNRMLRGGSPQVRQLHRIAESRGLKVWEVVKEIEEEEYLTN